MASTRERSCSGDRCSQQGSGERVTVSVVANWPGLIVLPRFRAKYSLVRSNQRPSSGSPSRRLRTQWTPGQSTDGSGGTYSGRDVDSRKPPATLAGHKGSVYSVAFSSDGKRLASASADQTVILWDVDNRKRLVTLEGHKGAVNAVAFSPDGKRLASASRDKTIILWDLDLDHLMAEACRTANRNLTCRNGEATSAPTSPITRPAGRYPDRRSATDFGGIGIARGFHQLSPDQSRRRAYSQGKTLVGRDDPAISWDSLVSSNRDAKAGAPETPSPDDSFQPRTL